MFDKAFFEEEFAKRVTEFSREREGANVKVEVVALTGERFDTLRLRAVITGARLLTRDDRLVFLPYPNIATIEISVFQDHRIPGFRLGFE